jgi:hypothetical protein
VDFFDIYFDKFVDDVDLLEEAYLQQDAIQAHYDFEGKGLIKILSVQPQFLIRYVKSLYAHEKFRNSLEHRDLGFVWKVKDIEHTLLIIFDFAVEQNQYIGILEHFCNSFFKGLNNESKERAVKFISDFIRSNHRDHNKMNLAIDIVRNSLPEHFEMFLLLFLTLNQNVEVFANILWRGSGTSGVGDVILSDIEAAEWRNILSIVEKSEVGIPLIPIKKYLIDRIESCLISGDYERQRRFLERY